MKKKILLALITSLLACGYAQAEFGYDDSNDITGEAYFMPPSPMVDLYPSKSSKTDKTLPPLTKLRAKLKNNAIKKEALNNELAPMPQDIYTGEIEASKYASQEIKDDFSDEIASPDGFEVDEEAIAEKETKKKSFFKRKNKEQKKDEDVILDCENVDYDSQNFMIYARGNVNVNFVKQGITLLADTITFDRANNTVKAEGNVKIIKGGQTVTGEYIFADLNEENALIEKPLMRTANVEVRSEKGQVYGDRVILNNGSVNVDESFPINFVSAKRTPQTHKMLLPEPNYISDDMEQGIIRLKVKKMKVEQNNKLQIISMNKFRLYKGDKLIFKTPAVKVYTNKNLEFIESNHWEIGAYRGLGVYAGPGLTWGMPHGAALKVMPIINYKSGLGFGALSRFSSATNKTMAAYGSAADKFILYGKQELDDKMFIHYSVNGYMDEWFLGRRRPKFGTSLVYKEGYSSNDFLLKNHQSSFMHRIEAGYFNDLDFDRNFEKIAGNDMGTTRFRYMAQVMQNLYNYQDKENQKSLSLNLIGQLSTSLYGTGDTQAIARFAPQLHTQYKRWMQDIGFYLATYQDNTPMPVFDAYRYGKQALFMREYFRINRLLTIAWFGNLNLSNDSPNGKDFQENGFYLSIGPDDVKFNIGYDFIRENLYAGLILNMDAKGSKMDYETLEIKKHENDKKAKNDKNEKAPVPQSDFKMSGQPILQRAVVENLKEVEDVI